MTVSKSVRILLTRTANEGALQFPLAANGAAHNVWFRARIQEAIDDPCPAVANDYVKAHFAQRRVGALKPTLAFDLALEKDFKLERVNICFGRGRRMCSTTSIC